jgi:hypothetical protein
MNLKANQKKEKSKGGGIAGLLLGIALFVALTVVLFNNEGNSVNRAKALKNISDAVEVSSESVASANEGALVVFSGLADTNGKLADEEFEVVAPDSTLKLRRMVEMYQWHEDSETDDDDNTTYSYYLDWSDSVIDSADFAQKGGHQNPMTIPYKELNLVVDEIHMGAFSLADEFVKKLNDYEPLELTNVTDDPWLVTSIEGNKIFQSAEGYSSYAYPEVGDVLITYEIVMPETVTVVGKQQGSSLVSYETKTGLLAEVSSGVKTKEAVMEEKLQQNTIKTFAIRIGSVIGLMVAMGMIFSPITSLLARIPLLGNLVNRGIGFIGSILGIAWGLLVIAVGWLFFKPVLAIILIVVAVGLIVLFAMKSKDKKEEAAA